MANIETIDIKLEKKENPKIKELLSFLDKYKQKNSYWEDYYYFWKDDNWNISLLKQDYIDKIDSHNPIKYRVFWENERINKQNYITLCFQAKWSFPDYFIVMISKKFNLIWKFSSSYEFKSFTTWTINKWKINIEKTISPEEIYHLRDFLDIAYKQKNSNKKNNVNLKLLKKIYIKSLNWKANIFENKNKPRKLKKFLDKNLFYNKDKIIDDILSNKKNKYTKKELHKMSRKQVNRVLEKLSNLNVIKVENLPF